jgi:peptidoglycan/xylan/chitin deacetylase (PgdA/CDA1 family)
MKVPILMYHRIGNDARDRRFTVSPERFKQQMQYLSDSGYCVVGLKSFVDALDGIASLPNKSVVLTFDDGFKETFDFACPVLKSFGYTAAFFLVTRLMGRTNEWMRRANYAGAPLMNWTHARRLLEEGFEIGSHTATHPALPEIDPTVARREIDESKRELEDRLGVAMRFFAYPFGRLNQTVQKLVSESGYLAACSTRSGFNNAQVDRYALRRLDIYGTDSIATLRRNLLFGENQMSLGRVTAYYMRRATNRLASLAR